MSENKKGYIYILTNPSFKEFVKIGYAHDVNQRLKQLNRSEALPYAFHIYATYEVNTELTDIDLHNLIDTLNPNLRTREKSENGKTRVREFFQMSKEDAYSILDSIAKITGTSNRLKLNDKDKAALQDEKSAEEVRENARRSNFCFSQVGIKVGEMIQFIEDPSIQAKVIDDRRIEYDGITTSLSALAQQLTGANHPLQGTLYFSYNGEQLNDLRLKCENH